MRLFFFSRLDCIFFYLYVEFYMDSVLIESAIQWGTRQELFLS
jgi:hypothetical protein